MYDKNQFSLALEPELCMKKKSIVAYQILALTGILTPFRNLSRHKAFHFLLFGVKMSVFSLQKDFKSNAIRAAKYLLLPLVHL